MGSDEPTSTGIAAITASGMTFALVSGNLYYFEFNVLYDCGNSTAGLSLGLTFPSAVVIAASARIPSGTGTEVIGNISSATSRVTATGNPAVGSQIYAKVEGVIQASANGNLALFYACEISTTGGPKIRAGTNGLLYTL